MEPKSNFLDKNTMTAMALIFAIFFGWNFYISKKYPNQNASSKTATANNVETTVATVTTSANAAEKAKPSSTAPAKQTAKSTQVIAEESLTEFTSENLSFSVSSKGMGLKNLTLKSYKNRQGNPVELGTASINILPFQTAYKDSHEPLQFSVHKNSDTEFVGKAIDGNVTIEKTMVIDPSTYSIKTTVKMKGIKPGVTGLETLLVEKNISAPASSMFSPATDLQEVIADNGLNTKPERNVFSLDNPQENKEFKAITLAGIGHLYFATAVKDQSTVIPDAKAFSYADQHTVVAIQYPQMAGSEELNLSYIAFAGPKSIGVLDKIDERMKKIVDLGFFAVLAAPMLKLLQFFHTLVSNWGLSIILLTIVVRLLVMPFNIMAFKSMKGMQTIKPKMDAIREKYKDNPTVMNEQIMRIMKENKVNPMGGCLPMLLQFPVFIALYALLAHSIELYQAPFAFWIHDLSLKDPFYVLPVLMGITMFIQQKITPSSMDPAQAKMMMFMPIFFSFMMVGLPSGLTLYIFVSTLFGIIQQKLFMENKTTPTNA